MNNIKGRLVSKDAFLMNSDYAKEPYEGILVSSDSENKQYRIGIQLDENQVLLVDQVNNWEVKEKLVSWIPRVNDIQRQYKVKNDLQNYDELQ
ncbi:hypothetical protein Desaci_1116 [Desulfosporosinus acidiphilus SJ4]|uniref:Uncharacterized protein n=1 Tax=Desulfosporosinus acidiphilus (strain DSM 22704 / JCM 16185 / SJ4) TaxID=646529 RepID=I4D2X9_DESAJ|nr:hypothetical protein [Desulfosporosinus acidiphilus]AFM40153.1 hypothetical protein Desaci_1116 [Desulfosporosinus acidiphilus SJ4]